MRKIKNFGIQLIYVMLDYNWQIKQSLSVYEQQERASSSLSSEQISPVLRIAKSLYLANYVIAYVLSFILLMPFLALAKTALLLALALSLLLFKLLNHYFSLQKLYLNEEAFLAFLKELIALLHNGTSFENAILILSPRLCKFYGEKTAFAILLKQICQALSNSWTLRDLQSEFLQLFPNHYAHNYFTILKDQIAVSNQLLKISQSFAKNMQAKANMEREIKANAAQQQMEAIILLAMPFLIIYVLRFLQSDFFLPALTNMPGPLLLLAAFICIALSALILFYLFMREGKKYKSNSKEHIFPIYLKLCKYYWPTLIEILPLAYIERIKRSLLICSALKSEQSSSNTYSLLLNKQELLTNYFAYKLQIMTYAFCILCLLSLLNYYLLCATIPLLIAVFYLLDWELQTKCQKELLALLELLPWDFSLLILLLKNNYSLINCFAKLQSLLNHSDPLRQKFHYFWQQGLLGTSVNKSFFNWTDNISDFTFNSYFSALHAYIANGDKSSLAALSEQTEQLFKNALIEHKQAQSKKQTAFLLPMMLDLIAVMLITLAPVIPSLAY